MKKNVLFVGGLCEGRRSVEAIGDALIAAGADDVVAMTSSRARSKTAELQRLESLASITVTHSIGVMAVLAECTPTDLFVFNPPLPTSRRKLIARGGVITAHMTADAIAEPELRIPTARYAAGYAAEALAHPVTNFRPLINGQISEYDIRRRMLHLPRDVQTTYVHTLGDEFFQPSKETISALCLRGINFVTCIGRHNRLVVDPSGLIEESGLGNTLRQDM